jgi:hypothetical protein
MAKFASDVGRPCVENAARFDAVRKVMQLAARDWTTAIGEQCRCQGHGTDEVMSFE